MDDLQRASRLLLAVVSTNRRPQNNGVFVSSNSPMERKDLIKGMMMEIMTVNINFQTIHNTMKGSVCKYTSKYTIETCDVTIKANLGTVNIK